MICQGARRTGRPSHGRQAGLRQHLRQHDASTPTTRQPTCQVIGRAVLEGMYAPEVAGFKTRCLQVWCICSTVRETVPASHSCNNKHGLQLYNHSCNQPHVDIHGVADHVDVQCIWGVWFSDCQHVNQHKNKSGCPVVCYPITIILPGLPRQRHPLHFQ